MKRTLTFRRLSMSMLIGAALAVPVADANAQNTIGGAIIGGATGAVIGGAATGRAGGAAVGAVIGAAAGAAIASQMEPRRSGYYWYRGRCWVRYPNGEYHRVSRAYCG